MNVQKQKQVEMVPNQQIKKFMPTVGMSYELEQKAANLAEIGKYEHNIDIDEKAKKKLDSQGSFLNLIDSLRYYEKAYLSKADVVKAITDFYNDLIENYSYFEYPSGYDDRTSKAILHQLSSKNKNLEYYCLIVNNILVRKFNEAYNMLNIY